MTYTWLYIDSWPSTTKTKQIKLPKRFVLELRTIFSSSDDYGVQLGDGHGQVGESIQHPEKVNIVNESKKCMQKLLS